MRIVFILTLLWFVSKPVYTNAQKHVITFGAGIELVSVKDYITELDLYHFNDSSSKNNTGFFITAVDNIRLKNNWFFSTGFKISMKSFTDAFKYQYFAGWTTDTLIYRNIRFNRTVNLTTNFFLFEIPLMLDYSLSNRLNLSIGVSPFFNAGSSKEVIYDSSNVENNAYSFKNSNNGINSLGINSSLLLNYILFKKIGFSVSYQRSMTNFFKKDDVEGVSEDSYYIYPHLYQGGHFSTFSFGLVYRL